MSDSIVMEDTSPRRIVFVVMPFAKTFEAVRKVIEAACKDAGAVAMRADHEPYVGTIPQRIMALISKADLIVADVSKELKVDGKTVSELSEAAGRRVSELSKKDGWTHNANVYYEVGYAHALGKPVVFLTQDDPSLLPFDTRQHPHMQYEKSELPAMKQELCEHVGHILNSDPGAAGVPRVEFYVDGVRLQDVSELPIKLWPQAHFENGRIVSNAQSVTIDAHNSAANGLRAIDFKVALQTNSPSLVFWSEYGEMPCSKLPEDGFVFSLSEMYHLLPGESLPLRFYFMTHKRERYWRGGAEVVLRCMTDWRPQEHPFVLDVPSRE